MPCPVDPRAKLAQGQGLDSDAIAKPVYIAFDALIQHGNGVRSCPERIQSRQKARAVPSEVEVGNSVLDQSFRQTQHAADILEFRIQHDLLDEGYPAGQAWEVEPAAGDGVQHAVCAGPPRKRPAAIADRKGQLEERSGFLRNGRRTAPIKPIGAKWRVTMVGAVIGPAPIDKRRDASVNPVAGSEESCHGLAIAPVATSPKGVRRTPDDLGQEFGERLELCSLQPLVQVIEH